MKNIHLIKTDKPSRLYEGNLGKPVTVQYASAQLKKPLNMYITNEEEIKDGDWMIRDNEQPIKVTKDFFWDFGVKYYKIILTTDQELIDDGVQSIDDEFLEWFVKNSSCERVEIRYTVDFNSKAVIIIPKEEPKQVTLEEVAEEYAISKSSSSVFQKAHIRDSIAGAKWQQERMYSDMQEYAEFCVKCDRNKMPLLTAEDWYKQHKK